MSNEHPELDKMMAIKDKSQVLGEFLDWLDSETEYCIATRCRDMDCLVRAHVSIEQLLADFFGIDLNKVEEEKRAILDGLRDS